VAALISHEGNQEMASTFATDGKVGAGFARRTLTPEFKLGTVAIGDENAGWLYVQADVAVAAAVTVATVNPTTFHITAATGGTGYTVDTAFAADEYGWVRKTAALV
jgi:hypothetical protein